MPLIEKCLNGSRYSELSNACKSVAARVTDDRMVVDLDPCMTGQLLLIVRYRKAKSVDDAAPAQHGVRRERTRQA
jgi:hypothetical protein